MCVVLMWIVHTYLQQCATNGKSVTKKGVFIFQFFFNLQFEKISNPMICDKQIRIAPFYTFANSFLQVLKKELEYQHLLKKMALAFSDWSVLFEILRSEKKPELRTSFRTSKLQVHCFSNMTLPTTHSCLWPTCNYICTTFEKDLLANAHVAKMV